MHRRQHTLHGEPSPARQHPQWAGQKSEPMPTHLFQVSAHLLVTGLRLSCFLMYAVHLKVLIQLRCGLARLECSAHTVKH